MNNLILFVLLLITLQTHAQTVITQPGHNPKLWHNKPADATVKDTSNGWVSDPEWLKSLPVGNGFIGAMVFGDITQQPPSKKVG